jgi:hypothetical protein
VISTDKSVVWVAESATVGGHYVAIFNLDSATQSFRYSWRDLGLPEGKHPVRDLWEHKNLASEKSVSLTLPPHGSVLYAVR